MRSHYQLKRNLPLGEKTSVGHADELPVHISAWSHWASFAGLHTCVVGAKEHESVQQGLLAGSQTAPDLNLQVLTSQHDEVEPFPGSQSSPSSTMPLPHICREMVFTPDPGSAKQVVLVLPPEVPAMSEPAKAW